MSINATLFIQLIVFFIGAMITMKFIWPPLIGALEERQKKIADSLAAAEKMKADLAKADEDRKRVLAETGVQAAKIIEEARAAAAKIGEAETQRAIATAADIIAKAKQANEAELASMRSELRKEAGKVWVRATQGALDEGPSPWTQALHSSLGPSPWTLYSLWTPALELPYWQSTTTKTHPRTTQEPAEDWS